MGHWLVAAKSNRANISYFDQYGVANSLYFLDQNLYNMSSFCIYCYQEVGIYDYFRNDRKLIDEYYSEQQKS